MKGGGFFLHYRDLACGVGDGEVSPSPGAFVQMFGGPVLGTSEARLQFLGYLIIV